MPNAGDPETYANPLWNRLGDGVGERVTLPERIPYQATLRAIGARLDDMKACRVNLMEVVDGFMVRYQQDASDVHAELVHFLQTELLSLSNELERRRRRRPFGLGAETETTGAYENVFRALGFELDQAEAYSLLIDELDDGLIVTYQYLRPSEGYQARKRMVILGAEAMEAVVEDARSRRDHRKENGIRLLAG